MAEQPPEDLDAYLDQYDRGETHTMPKDRLRQIYVTDEEATVLAKALALSVDPQCEPKDATDASLIVWQNVMAERVWDVRLGSLATMLAEAVARG